MSSRFIPFYFPQFHVIPENEKWWGQGYTDWQRVQNSSPIFKGHNQPRVPINDNYYDLSESKNIQWQIDLATQYNIYGFNFYHYWFDGKQLLEKPIQIFKELDHELKYCITWANETWTKRWDGKINEILVKQNHNYDVNEWNKHFAYLIEHFKDKKYITINEKPVFCIYRPDLFPRINDFISFFQDQAILHGLKGVHFIAVRNYDINFNTDKFDSYLRFQPRDYFGKLSEKSRFKKNITKQLRFLPEKYQIILSETILKFRKAKAYDFDDFWAKTLVTAKEDQGTEKRIFQSVIADWDNTPRYGQKAIYFKNVSVEKFEYNLEKLVEIENMRDPNFIFINAWNEWSEGAYLEPDVKNKFRYLEILKRISLG